MNDSPAARRTSKARIYLLAGVIVLVMLVVAGFNRGWLAWHSDQRPVGKLRPADLISSPASPETTLTAANATSSIPATTPLNGTTSTTRTAATTSPRAIDDDRPNVSATSDPINSMVGSTVPSVSVVGTKMGSDGDHDADD
jgi:hypothetical protein